MHTAPPSLNPAYTVVGFDYGTRRIGVAIGDTLTRMARAVKTLQVKEGKLPAGIVQLINDYAPRQLVVGVPYNMDGTDTTLTRSSMQFARELAKLTGLPVACVDERLSSREAEDALRTARAAGLKSRRVSHGDVDRIAARIVLQRWFDGETSLSV
jgi:putative Holliday junction resolvase